MPLDAESLQHPRLGAALQWCQRRAETRDAQARKGGGLGVTPPPISFPLVPPPDFKSHSGVVFPDPGRANLLTLLVLCGILFSIPFASADERRFGFSLPNWRIICSDYQGSDTPIDSQAIREALKLEGWDKKSREEVKQQCLDLGLL